MEIILSLLGVSLLPIAIVFFLPRENTFFNRAEVRGFGLGVYFMLVVVLLMESVEGLGSAMGLSWFGLGLIFSILIGLALKEFHHHHLKETGDRAHNKASTFRVLVSDFFHNIVDGVAIIAGFAISPVVGGISFLGILAHQILQQIGQHILLVEGGVKVARAIFISFLISLSIFLGFFLKEGSMESILLAISAGIVSWKVWVDLTHTKWENKSITGFLVGGLIFAIILLAIPHAHGDEHSEEEVGGEIHLES